MNDCSDASGFAEFVSHITNSEEALQAIIGAVAESRAHKDLILAAMTIPYARHPDFQKALDECYPSIPSDGGNTDCLNNARIIVSDLIPEEQKICIEKRGIRYSSLDKDRLRLPNIVIKFNWPDIITTPGMFVYLYPHSPQGDVQDHYGFFSRDEELSGRVYARMDMVAKRLEKDAGAVITLPPIEDIVNKHFLEKNKELLIPKKAGYISAGRFYESEKDAWKFFDGHSELVYHYVIDLELIQPVQRFIENML